MVSMVDQMVDQKATLLGQLILKISQHAIQT